MKVIQRALTLNRFGYYSKNLEIISCLLPTHLSPKEIEVLASFLSLDRYIIEDDMFNTLARKKVMSSVGLSPAGLSNHLKSMIRKKVIDKNEITNKLTIKEFLLPKEDIQGYQIKLTNNEVEDK